MKLSIRGRCPKCGKGMLVLRAGHFSFLLGCDLYPDCDFHVGEDYIFKDGRFVFHGKHLRRKFRKIYPWLDKYSFGEVK